MVRRRRVGLRVEITRGTLEGLHGTVVSTRSTALHHHRGRITIRLDPPHTWQGHTHVNVARRKLRRSRRPAPELVVPTEVTLEGAVLGAASPGGDRDDVQGISGP